MSGCGGKCGCGGTCGLAGPYGTRLSGAFGVSSSRERMTPRKSLGLADISEDRRRAVQDQQQFMLELALDERRRTQSLEAERADQARQERQQQRAIDNAQAAASESYLAQQRLLEASKGYLDTTLSKATLTALGVAAGVALIAFSRRKESRRNPGRRSSRHPRGFCPGTACPLHRPSSRPSAGGYHVETYGGGRYTAIAWFPSRKLAERERQQILLRNAWSGMPPRIVKGHYP